MVDLDGGAAARAGGRTGGRALVQVAEEDLARIVVLLLRHAGFAVERCARVADLLRPRPASACRSCSCWAGPTRPGPTRWAASIRRPPGTTAWSRSSRATARRRARPGPTA